MMQQSQTPLNGNNLPIGSKDASSPDSRSFEGEIRGNSLLLRRDLAAFLAQTNSDRTVVDALSMITCFPTSVAAALTWSVPEVQAATEELKQTLRGTVSDDVIDYKPVKRAFGALPPRP